MDLNIYCNTQEGKDLIKSEMDFNIIFLKEASRFHTVEVKSVEKT